MHNYGSRVLLGKLTVPQLVEKFPAIYRAQRFITVFKTARYVAFASVQSAPFCCTVSAYSSIPLQLYTNIRRTGQPYRVISFSIKTL